MGDNFFSFTPLFYFDRDNCCSFLNGGGVNRTCGIGFGSVELFWVEKNLSSFSNAKLEACGFDIMIIQVLCKLLNFKIILSLNYFII